jgi:two-component system phosphate regulon response regulator OmpR
LYQGVSRKQGVEGGPGDYNGPMDHPIRILVVDDDPGLRDLLSAYLTDTGFAVDLAADGAGMRRALQQAPPDAIVLDLMLPGQDGLALTRELRAQSGAAATIPILMLSARGEEIDRVVGLEVGADDYLAKPFSPRELLARLRALLRRTHTTPAVPQGQAYAFGQYRLDLPARRLLRDGEDVGLSGAELDLLLALIERPNRVLSRDTLLDLLKGYDRDPYDRTIDIRVARLRRKIEPDPANPVFIRTVRGEGYLFNPRGAAF